MKSLYQAAGLLAALALQTAGGAAQAADAAWPKIDTKDWQLASSTDAERVYVKPTPAGARHPRLLIRFETREPRTAEGVTFRSLMQALEFNCAKQTTRTLLSGVYKDNNMKGLLDSDASADEWRSVKPGSYEDLASKVACTDFVPAAQGPAWPALRKGEWELIEDEDDAKTYALPEWRRTYPRAWLRTEYLEPQEFNNRAYRSARSLVEIDCKRQRLRLSLSIQYPKNDLQGVPDMSGAMGQWQEPDLGSPEQIVALRICEAQDRAPAAGNPDDFGLRAVKEDAKYKGVQDLDWTPFGMHPSMRVFVQAANGGVYPQVLVRLEFLATLDLGMMKAKSSIAKYEVDCAGRRVREKTLAAYAGANLKGKGVDLSDPEADWRSLDTDDRLPLEALEPLCDLRLGDGKPVAPKPAPEATPPSAGVAGARRTGAAA